MRVLVLVALALTLLLMSSPLAANGKTFAVEVHKQEQLVDNQNDDQEVVQDPNGHTGTTLNNHHYIPRQDFSGHEGGNG